MPVIRNVVFDIGNVFVRWDSLAIVERALGVSGEEAVERRRTLFSESEIWLGLNRGEFTEAGAKRAYVDAGLLTGAEADRMFEALYDSFDLLEETPPLMDRLIDAGYRVFALTDNVHEIVEHLSARHDWWARFEGVTNSANLGVLKPDPRIYRHVLETNGLEPEESVFFDDMPANVAGAHAVGMQAFLFTDAAQAERDLQSIGVAV